MSFSSNSMEICSHTDKSLIKHISNVINDSLKSLKIILDTSCIRQYNDFLRDYIRIIGFSHDLGKATIYFQNKLSKGKKDRSKLSSHSLISSLFTLVILVMYFEKYSEDDPIKNVKSLFIIAGFTIVRDHHMNLNNLSSQLGELTTNYRNKNYLTKQINSLEENFTYLKDLYINFLKKNMSYFSDIEFTKIFDEVKEIIEKMVTGKSEKIHTNSIYPFIVRNFKQFISRKKNPNKKIFFFLLIKIINSIFLESDKMDAAFDGTIDLGKNKTLMNLPPQIDQYITEIRKNTIDKLNPININRNKIFNDSKMKIHQYNKENLNKILTFNAPTGFGKTISVINCISEMINYKSSMQHNDNLIKINLSQSKIIYCLPFLSITDQINETFQQILKIDSNKPSEKLLCHNHRTEMSYKGLDDEMSAGLDAKLLIEGWNADIVVTTFHQLFYSLFYNRNMLNIKFHKLMNSIIILDEIQCFPLKYWNLIREIFLIFIKKFKMKVVLVSATLPMIFDPNTSYELVENKEEYFNQLNRIKIFIQPEINKKNFNFESDNLLKLFIKLFESKKDFNSFLCVLNTRKSARDFFKSLKNEKKNSNKIKLFFLSSDILVKQRQELIKKIKNLIPEIKKSQKKIILISTQVIEAGVDLDFDLVIRDFAPLDSLIQVAGRCNRNNSSQNKGEFYIIKLYDKENDDYFSNYIYDYDLLKITKKILLKSNNINTINSEFLELFENEWFNMSHKYFKKITNEKYFSPDYSIDIIEDIQRFNFSDISKEFVLIENTYNYQFYLDIDNDSHKIWMEYLAIKEEKDRLERLDKYLTIKSKFESNILNYRANKEEMKSISHFLKKYNLNSLDRNFIYISNEYIEKIYDECGLNFENFKSN